MRAFYVILLTILAVLSAVCNGQPLGQEETAKVQDELTTAKPSNFYFGVDANDKEAVKEKQRQMAKDQWKKLFPEIDINELNFEFGVEKPNFIMKGLENVQGAFNKVIGMIKASIARQDKA